MGHNRPKRASKVPGFHGIAGLPINPLWVSRGGPGPHPLARLRHADPGPRAAAAHLRLGLARLPGRLPPTVFLYYLGWFWCISDGPGHSRKVREGPGQKLKKVVKSQISEV